MPNDRMRIVSLLPSSTEIVCALGLDDSLVGITHECDYPPSVAGKPRLTSSHISHETMNSAEIDHAVRSQLAQLDGHGSIYDLDEVRLRELNPDLILTQELCDVCAVSYKTVELAGRASEAGRLVDDLNARLDRVKAIAARSDRRPRTLMLEWLEPAFAPGH